MRLALFRPIVRPGTCPAGSPKHEIGSERNLAAWECACPRRPLDELAANIDQLLADTSALIPESFPLSAAQIADLRGRAPEFKAMCAALASYRVPQTLEHGDFSPGQVVLQGDRNIFIDW